MVEPTTRGVRIAVCAIVGCFALAIVGPAAASSELVSVRMALVDSDEFVQLPSRVGELDDGDVLDISASGFEEYGAGVVRQCDRAIASSCRNSYPVRFDEVGNARFQFRVVAAIRDACRRCSVELVSGDDVVVVDLWFGQPAPAFGRVDVTPRSAIEPGDELEVRVSGFPSGSDATVVLCRAPAVEGVDQCGSPGATNRLRVGDDGRGGARFVIETGAVGRAGAECGRGSTCAVAVLVDNLAVAQPIPITFAAIEGAEYQSARLAGGLLMALALVVLALVVWRRVDWSAVGEVAAPEIDDAVYADLDAIIAALPPEDDERELVSPRGR